MSQSPRALCPPLLLHESGGSRCWATVVTTSLGLSVTVCIEAPNEADLRRVTSEEYNVWGKAVNLAARAPESTTGLLLLPWDDSTATAHYAHFLAPAGTADPEQGWLLEILLPGLRHTACLRSAAPEGPTYDATYVVPPAVLHEDDAWLLWHEGIIRSPSGWYGIAVARKRPGPSPLWDTDRGEEVPLSGFFKPSWDPASQYALEAERAMMAVFTATDETPATAEIVLRPAGKKFTLRW